jgi:hypothetical protein
MWYEETKSDLKDIIEWLATDDTDEENWRENFELAEHTVFDMRNMSRRADPPAKKGSGAEKMPDDVPQAARLVRAIPYARAMLAAMTGRNRARALEEARSALAAM